MSLLKTIQGILLTFFLGDIPENHVEERTNGLGLILCGREDHLRNIYSLMSTYDYVSEMLMCICEWMEDR